MLAELTTYLIANTAFYNKHCIKSILNFSYSPSVDTSLQLAAPDVGQTSTLSCDHPSAGGIRRPSFTETPRKFPVLGFLYRKPIADAPNCDWRVAIDSSPESSKSSSIFSPCSDVATRIVHSPLSTRAVAYNTGIEIYSCICLECSHLVHAEPRDSRVGT